MIRFDQPHHSPFQVRPLGLLAAIVLAAAACSPASGPLGSPATPPVTSEPSVEAPSADVTPGTTSPSPSATPSEPAGPSASPLIPSPSPTGTVIVRAYFLIGEDLVPVLRQVPETQAVATAAMRQLLAGPTVKEQAASPALSTTIPTGSQLLGLSITGGVATVNLSREFESGGGSASMFGRLAQVVYTLTQFSTVDSVLFQLDGTPVTVFGGEGLVLDHAVGRADYQDQLPAIFVDRPAWGAAIGNPGTVSGLANVFEAVFRVQLLDATGTVLVDNQLMASCGTGCWGTFKTQLAYTVGKAQWGTLRVYDLSAKDGSQENVRSYPVWLTPAA